MFFILIAAGGEIASAQQPAQASGRSLELTFLANEGVLIESGSHKVLIDALFDKPNPEYAKPSKEVSGKLETGQEPFHDIDLVLVTHNHPDHMSCSSLSRFLQHNPGARLAAPKDAILELKASYPEWEAVQERVVAVEIPLNTYQELTVRDIRLKVFRTLHSGDLESPWNLMYLVFMDGVTVFHEGDSDAKIETYKHLGLQNIPIDLALVHFWFPLHPVGEKLLLEVLDCKHIGLFHLPLSLYDDAPLKIDMVKQHYSDLFLLTECGQRRSIH